MGSGVPFLDDAKAFVKITGLRRGHFVEFEFSINDADLTVELVMPTAEFEEFCHRENCTMLPPDESIRSQVQKFMDRERRLGRFDGID